MLEICKMQTDICIDQATIDAYIEESKCKKTSKQKIKPRQSILEPTPIKNLDPNESKTNDTIIGDSNLKR